MQARLVIEDSAEVADDIDDSEDQAALGEHGEVGATHVAGNGIDSGLFLQVLPHLHSMQRDQRFPWK